VGRTTTAIALAAALTACSDGRGEGTGGSSGGSVTVTGSAACPVAQGDAAVCPALAGAPPGWVGCTNARISASKVTICTRRDRRGRRLELCDDGRCGAPHRVLLRPGLRGGGRTVLHRHGVLRAPRTRNSAGLRHQSRRPVLLSRSALTPRRRQDAPGQHELQAPAAVVIVQVHEEWPLYEHVQIEPMQDALQVLPAWS
jgi:hypothetical protein